jgi:hypothetical protein
LCTSFSANVSGGKKSSSGFILEASSLGVSTRLKNSQRVGTVPALI